MIKEYKYEYDIPTSFEKFFEAASLKPIPKFVTPDRNGIILNVGAGYKNIIGTASLDLPEWNAEVDAIPYGNATVSGIIAMGFLEHVKNVTFVLSEFQRVLKPGCAASICVPYYNSQLQAQDLDHKSMFCEETWKHLFKSKIYDRNLIGLAVEWEFDIGLNIIAGMEERNTFLFTQLIKR